MNRLARLVAKLRPAPFDPPPTRLPLLNFSADKLDSWQLQTDAPIGGFSEAALSPLPGVEGRALWSGVTSLDADRLVQQKYRRSDQKAVASKVGFAAMMLPVEEEHWALYDYHGLCLTCRPRDARNYVLTVRAAGSLGDHRTEDLYQTLLQPFVTHAKPAATTEGQDADDDHAAQVAAATATGGGDGGSSLKQSDGPTGPLLDVRVPWGAFTLTWRGYVQSPRPPAMHLENMNTVGLLLADKTAGDFGIELAGLSAFRYEDGEDSRDEHVRKCLELNLEAGYEDAVSG